MFGFNDSVLWFVFYHSFNIKGHEKRVLIHFEQKHANSQLRLSLFRMIRGRRVDLCPAVCDSGSIEEPGGAEAGAKVRE